MMYGRDQSDSPVRARKSTNNAERSAAEPMERRGEAKGKAVSPSTRGWAVYGISFGTIGKLVSRRYSTTSISLCYGGRISRSSAMRPPESTVLRGTRTVNVSRRTSPTFMLACIVEPIARFPLGGG